MMRALWTAASGMIGEQFHIDVIANNLANINTAGFKKSRAEFEDLLYQTQRLAGTPSSEISQYPVGIQTGLGVRPSATQKFYTQGNLQQTGNATDIAIENEGFFGVTMPDGSNAFTRDGTFKIDANKELVTSQGYRLNPPVILPDDFIKSTLTISPDGLITVKVPGQDDPVEVGPRRSHKRRPELGERKPCVRRGRAGYPLAERLRHGFAGLPRNVQCQRGTGNGRYDRRPARLRIQLQVHPDLRLHARHRKQLETLNNKDLFLTGSTISVPLFLSLRA